METETSMRRCIYTTLSSFSKGKNYQPQIIYEIYCIDNFRVVYSGMHTHPYAHSGEIMKKKFHFVAFIARLVDNGDICYNCVYTMN